MYSCTIFLEFVRIAAQTTENRTNSIIDNAHRCAYINGMTVDERIEKLTERHEALTQSVELLTKDVRDLAALGEGHRAGHGSFAQHS
jgi:hypothetical protein